MSTRLLLGLAVVVLLALLGAWLLLDTAPGGDGGAAPLAPSGDVDTPAARNPDALNRQRGGVARDEQLATPTRLPDAGAGLTRASGRVVSRAGTPLADARVFGLVVPKNLFDGPPTLSGQETRTDTDGHFELLGLPAGVRLAVEADAEGYAPNRRQGFKLADG